MDCLFLSWFYWDPNRELFTVPIIERPIGWYGLFFVSGIICSYLIVLSIIRNLLLERHTFKKDEEIKSLALSLTDRLTWLVVIGIIIGARLGHVFFYDWPFYKRYPFEILNVSEGGLASHGGAIGVICAIALFCYINRKKFPELTFWSVVDIVCVPAALAGFFIRLGNFFNQEILGTPSQVPWAVIFGHPADRSLPEPRHPVQLYEAIAYLLLFFVIFAIWKGTKARTKPGLISGLFLVFLFTIRFFLEFFKTSQSLVIDESGLQMGQLLSLPFILGGLILIWKSQRSKSQFNVKKE